jgi:transcription elongation factor GreB
MSRGFVKEGDQEEPPMIPPRAALPDGVTNYVTPEGHEDLLNEKSQLIEERAALDNDDEQDKRRMSAEIDGKINLLQDRINSARVLEPSDQSKNEVRFGALVEYEMGNSGKSVSFQIVGVDEVDVKKKKIAFTSPIAKAMIGHKVGEKITFSLGEEARSFKIISINY